MVDVLDRDRTGLHARATGDAVPHRVLGHRVRHQGVTLAREQVVTQAHDHQLRRERFARRECRAGILAASALGARERVEHLLPGEIRGGAGAEPDVIVALPLGRLELQRLKPAAGARAHEPDVRGGGEDVQVLGAGQVGQECQDREHVHPHEHPLQHPRGLPAGEQVRERVGNRRGRGGPLVQMQRDPGRVPQQQRDHDRRDQAEDQVGLAQVAAVEPARALDLADPECGEHTDQHERGEDIDEQRVPPLSTQPREGRVPVDDPDHRDQDRRQQHDEAPEDERVHQPRAGSLQQLALTEHDARLVAHALAGVAGARLGLRRAHQGDQSPPAQREDRAARRDRGREQHRSQRRSYVPLAFLISAEIAGSTS